MKKIGLSLGLLMTAWAYAEAPDLNVEIQNFEEMVSEFAQKAAGDGKIGIFVRTEEDKFIRIYSAFPNARGTELSGKVAKILASKGSYESQDETFPELGVQCKKFIMKLSKDNKIAMSYGEGCEKKL